MFLHICPYNTPYLIINQLFKHITQLSEIHWHNACPFSNGLNNFINQYLEDLLMKTKYTVYIVDHDNVNLKIITRKLQRELNCRAYGFSSAETCLIAMERKTPDLVLSDCGNAEEGKMTGEEMLLGIKNEFPKVPVIMYTSIESMDLAVNMMRAGATNFVPKQLFFFQKIVQAVHEEINRIKSRYSERRTKFMLLGLIASVVGITLYFNFNRQEWLMYFILGSLMIASLFVFWDRKQPAVDQNNDSSPDMVN